MSEKWLVSACLLGTPCRYDGRSKGHERVKAAVRAHRARGGVVEAVCPEELGGLGTPRPAAHLVGGTGAEVWSDRASVCRVEDGADVTEAFRKGALDALARAPDATRAIVKARSPSCGCGKTMREGQLTEGDGVFAALLRSRGLILSTEED